jgi:hypothetical protein
MISEIITLVKRLEKEGFSKMEATQIILILELQEVKKILNEHRDY